MIKKDIAEALDPETVELCIKTAGDLGAALDELEKWTSGLIEDGGEK